MDTEISICSSAPHYMSFIFRSKINVKYGQEDNINYGSKDGCITAWRLLQCKMTHGLQHEDLYDSEDARIAA